MIRITITLTQEDGTQTRTRHELHPTQASVDECMAKFAALLLEGLQKARKPAP